MTRDESYGRLMNRDGEIVAEGPCWLDEGSPLATMEPQRTPGAIRTQRGDLTLKLDSGQSLRVSDRTMLVRTRNGSNQVRSLYRLRLIDAASDAAEQAQEAEAAGAVGEGRPTSPSAGPRFDGETPAAR